MNAQMESVVSSALMRWRFIERALHSHQEWSMEYAGVVVPARRIVTEDSIRFEADFPAMCALDDPALQVVLLEADEAVIGEVLDEAVCEDGGQVVLEYRVSDVVPAE